MSIVENLEHRAGKDAEGKTGDGVGILLQISHKFFVKACQGSRNCTWPEEREYGVGMFFFPQDELKTKPGKKMFEIIVEKEGVEFLGWRDGCRSYRIFSDIRQSTVCRILCRVSSRNRQRCGKGTGF